MVFCCDGGIGFAIGLGRAVIVFVEGILVAAALLAQKVWSILIVLFV